jgi:transcriptional regulator with XRE-family HTH domain
MIRNPRPRQHLVQALKQRRNELGWSLIETDRRLGFAEGLVSKWECGDRRPSLSSLAAWATALGCRITVEHVHPSPMELINEDSLLETLERRGIRLQVVKTDQKTAETPVRQIHRTGISLPFSPDDVQPLADITTHYTNAALAASQGNQRLTAEKLKISYRTLRRHTKRTKVQK